ncbi:shufflon protein A [Escherichia coli PA7]|nr:shufflon protein A [Escherichia coli PA7]
MRLTEVTAIWVHTGERLTGEITAAEPCLCTLPVEIVPVAVIAPTHQIFRAM